MFNGAYIHLLLNHIPIIGLVFVLPLLVAGVVNKNRSLAIAGLMMMVAVAIVSIPTFLSGEEAEELVEGMPGVSESSIEEHEEQSEIAYYGMLMAGAVALGALISAKGGKPVAGTLMWITIAINVIVFVLMVRTGYSGGQIRHTEINRTVQVEAESED